MTERRWREKLEKALRLLQTDAPMEAMHLFEDILKEFPDQPDALHGMGMAYAQQRQFNEALPYLEKACLTAPTIAEFHNNLANAYKACANVNAALKHYHEALRLKSPYPQAHNNLGSLLYKMGRYDEAEDHFQKSLRMDPEAVDTHFNLGITLLQQNRLNEAITHFEEVLKRRPDHLSALHNLGISFCGVKRYADAIPLLEQARIRDPHNVDILFYLALSLNNIGRLDEALAIYHEIIRQHPEHAGTHHNLATLYLNKNDKENALKHYTDALKHNASNTTAKHMIEALSGKTSSEGAPRDYVRSLFDQYAEHYNQHMQVNLQYKTPTLLRSALTPWVINMSQPIKGLDLGCGSGLCAPYFSDIVSKLTGVDISENMIIQAKKQGGYDKLIVSDILDFLEYKFTEFDLIISADVFVYFGNLEKLFKFCRQALKGQGLFCFSIETLTKEEIQNNPALPDFQLRPTGRYAHNPDYIQKLSKSLHFPILSESPDIIRTQETFPINGNIYVLKKENTP